MKVTWLNKKGHGIEEIPVAKMEQRLLDENLKPSEVLLVEEGKVIDLADCTEDSEILVVPNVAGG